LVVVLIIAILLAIAIPTFLGARNTANARAAQSNVRNALTVEQTYFTNNNQEYGNAAAVATIEPAIGWVDITGARFTPTATPANQVFDLVSTHHGHQ
jgi:type IV pilus assembly protein PilA